MEKQAENKRVLFGCDEFDLELCDRAGGLLNPQLWALNVDWTCPEAGSTITFAYKLFMVG